MENSFCELVFCVAFLILISDGQKAVQRACIGSLNGKVSQSFFSSCSNIADELVALGGCDSIARDLGRNIINDAFALYSQKETEA